MASIQTLSNYVETGKYFKPKLEEAISEWMLLLTNGILQRYANIKLETI